MAKGIPNTTPAAKFRRLYENERLTLGQVANACGYSDPKAVTSRASAMGLTLRTIGPGRRRKVCKDTAIVLKRLGLSQRDIAISFGATQQAVSLAMRSDP